MTYIKMNEKLAKYTKEELETKVKELSDQGMSKSGIYRTLGVSADVFLRHMAILKDPEGFMKKLEENKALKEQVKANKLIKVLEGEDNFWLLPEVALEKFKKDFKERKQQITLKEAIDPYY